MSWHFSRALVAESLAENCLGGTPSALLNTSPTLLGFCSSDKTIEFFRRSRSGMTFEHSTESLGGELLTSFLAASHARTSAAPARGQELPANDPAFGEKWPASFARYNPDTCSWKTPQCSLFEDLELSLEIWPRWGSMRNGECWERTPSAQTTSENESGYWPTPCSGPCDSSCTMETTLKWDNGKHQLTLTREVAREEKAAGRHIPHGTLNPPWVEWLMGWPTGWTDLKPLAMDKFREWWRLHGGF